LRRALLIALASRLLLSGSARSRWIAPGRLYLRLYLRFVALRFVAFHCPLPTLDAITLKVATFASVAPPDLDPLERVKGIEPSS
jgi:hypothetical protein